MTHETRSPDIDLARCIAISMMILFHAAYDLSTYYRWNIDIHHGGWWLLGKGSATLFLLLVGMSFSLSWNRSPEWSRFLLRGTRVFGYGMIVTVVTYFLEPVTFVRFGILHLIGLSLMVLPLTPRLGYWNGIVGAVIIGIGILIKEKVGSTLTIIFGMIPSDLVTVDYYPLFPWLGVILIGVSLGQLFLAAKSPSFFRTRPLWFGWITQISQKSLLIYMVHQPILLAVLWLTLGRPDQ